MANAADDEHHQPKPAGRSSEANNARFKSAIAGLKRQKRFIGRRESSDYAMGLEAMLDDFKMGNHQPKEGLELLISFIKTSSHVFSHCDDSNGSIGGVYRFNAVDLFAMLSAKCDEKEWIAKQLFDLVKGDEYGICHDLLKRAGEYLPELILRDLADQCYEVAATVTDKIKRMHWTIPVTTIAEQLKDPALYEKACRLDGDELPTASCFEIAKINRDAGNLKAALEWLGRIPDTQRYLADERKELLLDIHKKLGNQEESERIAWEIFTNDRASDNLETLLGVIGPDKRQEVIAGETKKILADNRLTYSDAYFFIENGLSDKAAEYLIARKKQLNGVFYTTLLPLAKEMEKNGQYLAAYVLYQALLESILKRAISKYYTHGVRYLKRLDLLGKEISDWQSVAPHPEYLSWLKSAHARKSSFWSRYDKKKP